MDDLREYARTFPSQGGVEIGSWLERYAAEVPEGSSIVEFGCWLGAGTAWLALGATQSGAEIHVYDRFFCVNDEEKRKAAKFGIDLLVGEDTLLRVERSLERFSVRIHFHKGSIGKRSLPQSLSWSGQPIGLYVDDASKTNWETVIAKMKPRFIKGKTVLVLMDFYFREEYGDTDRYAVQRRYMKAHASEYEFMEERMGGTSVAVFRYLGK